MPLTADNGNTDLYTMMQTCGMGSDPNLPAPLLYANSLIQVEARNGISYLQPQ